MDLSDVVAKRYSVRAFNDQPVSEAALKSILETANAAPSAGNRQAYEIVVVRDAKRRRQLAVASHEQWFVAEAPVVLIFFANPERNRERYRERGVSLYCLQDSAVACAYAQLAATALGLGTCWVGSFEDRAVSEILGAPASWQPVAILPIGQPADKPRPRERRPLSNLAHHEKAGSE
ncbi:MAG: nitroreductase family protein [Verrucomicrobia bacterium]|nr:nitroreductase family protein [Verrucomicrobiota bacterium]